MNGIVVAETIRRHLTSIAFWGYVALLAIVGVGTAKFNSPAAAWPTLVALLAIITGSRPIGPEFSSGTLQLILVKPVTRSAYLLSRVAGVVAVLWLAIVVACGAELVGRAIFGQELHLDLLGAAAVNAVAGSLLTVALLTFFGSFTRAYFNAAIYVGLQIALGVAMAAATAMRRMPTLVRILDGTMKNVFPDAPRALDTQWLLILLSNAAVALVLACLIFRRREVPYGAD